MQPTTRTAGGVTTNFNWGSKGIDIETQGASVSAQNTFGPFLVDRWASPNPNYSEYPLYDWQGSVRFATSWPGTNFSAVYDAFGQVVTAGGSTYDPYLFAGASGYRNDQDAGLVDAGAGSHSVA